MKKILITDSLKYLVSGENILNRANVQILTAASSQEILSIHKSEKADLIVIDLDMPGMTGDGICTQLRKVADPVKVLIAVEPEDADIKRAEQCGASTYITKPINPPLFFSKIATLLGVHTRRAYRMPVKVAVSGEAGASKITASTINISSTGILIESAHALNAGDVISCLFLLPGTLAISVQGEVVRVVKKPAGSVHQYGIRFTSISASAQRIIEDFVKSRFEPPV